MSFAPPETCEREKLRDRSGLRTLHFRQVAEARLVEREAVDDPRREADAEQRLEVEVDLGGDQRLAVGGVMSPGSAATSPSTTRWVVASTPGDFSVPVEDQLIVLVSANACDDSMAVVGEPERPDHLVDGEEDVAELLGRELLVAGGKVGKDEAPLCSFWVSRISRLYSMVPALNITSIGRISANSIAETPRLSRKQAEQA